MTDTDLRAAVADMRNVSLSGATWDSNDFETYEEMRATYIAAILNAVASGDLVPRAELDAARGRVKPLEWREVNDGNRRKGEVFGTRSPVSFAPITAHKKHDGWWLSADCKTYPTLEAAKAAAQADYAARILAALEPDPAVVRMREALVEHNDLLRSTFAIAEREGVKGMVASTNWDAFYNRVAVLLKRHHALTNEARAALKEE